MPDRVAEMSCLLRDRVREDRCQGIVQIVICGDACRAAPLHDQSGVHQRFSRAAHMCQRHGRNLRVTGTRDR
jgi:hypothetical protein